MIQMNALTFVLLVLTMNEARSQGCREVAAPRCPPTLTQVTYLPHPANCALYLRCEKGHVMTLSCPEGQMFDEEKKTCTKNDRCDICRENLATCPETPTCTNEEIGVNLPYPTDCTKYIYCDGTEFGILRSCPIDMHFSIEISFCTDIELANCNECNEITSISSSTTSSTIGLCPETPKCNESDAGLTKPYPPDCSRYIYCSISGEAILSRCPLGMHYSEELAICTSREEANCKQCYQQTTTPEFCPEIPSCINSVPGDTKPYPADCTKYVYCIEGGIGEIRSCPTNKHFSPEQLYCMAPRDAKCPFCQEVSTTLAVCPETPTCEPEESGLKKPYPPDCSMYIYCDEMGEELLSSCPMGEHFNVVEKDCTSPEEANCQECQEYVTTPSSMED